MIANIDWDTGMVLSTILAPLCIGLFIVCLMQWQRINELKNDKEAALGKVAERDKVIANSRADCDRRLAEASAQKDTEIQRQKKEIENLHSELNVMRINRDKDLRLFGQSPQPGDLPSESCL